MKTKLFNALSLAIIMAMLVTSLALADDVVYDVAAAVNFTSLIAGGSSTKVDLYIAPQNGDGKNGCNLTGGTILKVDVLSSDTAVAEVSPAEITFTNCEAIGSNLLTAVTVIPKSAGTATISLALDTNTTAGTFNLATATFTAVVSSAIQNQTITFGTLSDKTYGDADFNVSASASSGLPVSFAASGNCSVSGILVHLTGAGSCTITASQGGNASYNSAPDVSRVFNIAKANPGCSISGYAGTYDGAAHGASGSCTGVGTLDLGGSFTDVPGGTAYWTFTGNANYNNDGGNVPIVISQASVTATAGGGSSVYDGATHSPSACAVIGVYTGDLSCANAPSSVGPDAGTYPISPVVSGTGLSNFAVTEVGGSYEIEKAATTTTVSCPTSVVYNGSAQEPCTAKVTGPGGLDQSLTVSYSDNTNAGTASASASFAGDNNYLPSGDSTTFTIEKAPVTATAGSGSGTYSGSAQFPSACLVSGAYTGDLTCVNNPASVGPNAGTYPISPVVSGTGLSNFDVTSVPGSYIINKADATCSVTGWTGYYDGAFHGASGTCTGVGGADLNAGLSLGDSFKNVPGGTAYWSFSGGTNYNNQNGSVAIVIDPWTFLGFYQPVDMGATVWNTVKGGSTIPFKFEVFAGSLELTDTSVVKSFNTTQVLCSGGTEDTIELVATGGTSLRYDWTSGQFIYNWQTPKKPGFCYKVTFTLQDGSTRSANFKLK